MVVLKKGVYRSVLALVCVALLAVSVWAYNEPEDWPETYPWDFEIYGPYGPDAGEQGGTVVDGEPTAPTPPSPDSGGSSSDSGETPVPPDTSSGSQRSISMPLFVSEFFSIIGVDVVPSSTLAELIPYVLTVVVGVALVSGVFGVIGKIAEAFTDFMRWR